MSAFVSFSHQMLLACPFLFSSQNCLHVVTQTPSYPQYCLGFNKQQLYIIVGPKKCLIFNYLWGPHQVMKWLACIDSLRRPRAHLQAQRLGLNESAHMQRSQEQQNYLPGYVFQCLKINPQIVPVIRVKIYYIFFPVRIKSFVKWRPSIHLIGFNRLKMYVSATRGSTVYHNMIKSIPSLQTASSPVW